MSHVQILIGDCRDMMRTLPAGSVQTVITSPPYYQLRDYGVEGQIGMEASPEEFLEVMVEVFEDIRRVLRDDGTAWVNMGDSYHNGGKPKTANGHTHVEGGRKKLEAHKGERIGGQYSTGWNLKPKDLIGMPWRLAFALQEAGWWLRSEVIWSKPNPIPQNSSYKRPTVAHEQVFLLTKSPDYYYDEDAIRETRGDEPSWEEYEASLGSNIGCDSNRWTAGYKKMSHNQTHPNGRNKRTVWEIPTEGFKGSHYATFPRKLVEPCLLAGTSERGACGACGAPLVRITKPSPEYEARLGKSWHDHKGDTARGQRGVPSAFRGAPARITTGWERSCSCKTDSIKPCVVMDPFGGTGTVGEVAMQQGRDAILIDLDGRNLAFMEERTAQQRLNLLGAM